MILRLFLFFILLVSCRNQVKTDTEIQVRVLRGPSAIALARLIKYPETVDGRVLSIKIIDSPDIMLAQLIKGEADIAVLPTISAVNLYNKGINYPLLGCPVWGTLYIAGRGPLADKPLYLFGAGTTPDMISRYYLRQQGVSTDNIPLNYSFATAREVMQALLSKSIDQAVLSEPFLSIALKQDTSLQIIADLNQPCGMINGFAQTAIVFHPTLQPYRAILDSILNVSCNYAISHPEEVISIVEKEQIFAPGTLTPASVKRCMINYVPAIEAADKIDQFLNIIYQYEPKAIGGKLPDSSFICNKP